MQMNPWKVTTDPLTLRRLGKLSEELGELQAVIGRIIIQGIDAIDPSSGDDNRLRLEKELADVLAQCNVTIDALALKRGDIEARQYQKMMQMAEWEATLRDEPSADEKKYEWPAKPTVDDLTFETHTGVRGPQQPTEIDPPKATVKLMTVEPGTPGSIEVATRVEFDPDGRVVRTQYASILAVLVAPEPPEPASPECGSRPLTGGASIISVSCKCRMCNLSTARENAECSKCGRNDCPKAESHYNRCLTDPERVAAGDGFRGMIVCARCGNKRCPHAQDPNLACTNSNEPGQIGVPIAPGIDLVRSGADGCPPRPPKLVCYQCHSPTCPRARDHRKPCDKATNDHAGTS